MSYLRKYSPYSLNSDILVEMGDSLKTFISQFPPLLKKKCEMMHFEIMLVKIKASSSIDEPWRNVSTSLCPIKSINDFGRDSIIHCFSSLLNTPFMTPVRTNKFKLPLIVKSLLLHFIRCLNLHIFCFLLS